MTTMQVRENVNGSGGTNALLSFNHEGEYPITIGAPFAQQEEKRLESYSKTTCVSPSPAINLLIVTARAE